MKRLVLLLLFSIVHSQVLTIPCVGSQPCIASIFADTNFKVPFSPYTTNMGSILNYDTTLVVNGTNSLRIQLDNQGDSGFYAFTSYPWYASDFTNLEFWIRSTSNASPANYFRGLFVAATNGPLATATAILSIANCAPGNPVVWQLCRIPFTDLMPQMATDPKALVSRIYIIRNNTIEPLRLTINMDEFQIVRTSDGNQMISSSTSSGTNGNKKATLSAGGAAALAIGCFLVFLTVIFVIVAVYINWRRKQVRTSVPVPSPPESQIISPSSPHSSSKSHLSQSSVLLNPVYATPIGPSYQSYASSRTDSSRWEISFDEIVFGDAIGAGAFGEVYVANWRDSRVAVKILTGLIGNEAIEAFRKEADIMAAIRPHKNVIQFLGISSSSPNYCIVLEYAEGGSLHNYLSKSKKLPTDEVLNLAKGVAAGMLHLAKERFVHRDLAARNVLLDGQQNPKISDFGMSRCLELSNQGQTKTYVGPVRWMSPESIKSHEYSEKSDVWSFGVLIWEILMRQEPYLKRDPLEVALEIRERFMTPEVPKDAHPVFVQLMLNCWKPNPNERPTFDDISYFLQEAKL